MSVAGRSGHGRRSIAGQKPVAEKVYHGLAEIISAG